PPPRTPASRSPTRGSAPAARRRDRTSRRPARGPDGTGGPRSCVGLEPHDRIVAVAEDRLIQKTHVLTNLRIADVLVEAALRRREGAYSDAGEALDLQIEGEELGRDRSEMAGIQPEGVAGDGKTRRVG